MPDSNAERHPIDALAEQFAERLRRGELPSLTEYVQQYPELADEIREAFPALVMMEQLKPTSADIASTPETKPEQMGDYRLLREIGRGGMGVVYEAEQISLNRHVALKVFPRDQRSNPTYLERFRREAKAAARLQHANIVPVYGVGEAEGVHFYAMQFIPGEGLDKILHDIRRLRSGPDTSVADSARIASVPAGSVAASLLTGPFEPIAPEPPGNASPTDTDLGRSSVTLSGTESEAEYCRNVARIGLQVAEGLAHAHNQGILHRDIKPSNLLLDLKGNVWITDFGLAKTEDAEELTTTGDLVGTLRYMAPERFEGTSLPQSDVYALGITLYEMLTLRPAFGDSNRARLIQRILHEDPPAPRRFEPRIPRDLETIVLKASAHDAGRRYATAEDLAEDLHRFLEDRPIRARRSWLPERLWRWCRRNPAVASLLGVIVLLLLLLALGLAHRSWWSGQVVDAFQPGSRWSGQAFWGADKSKGPWIIVDVHERNGEHFKGSYLALEDPEWYEWRIEGTIAPDAIQWRFTEVIHEARPTGVVEHAHVEGAPDGKALRVTYWDADSIAQMVLRQAR